MTSLPEPQVKIFSSHILGYSHVPTSLITHKKLALAITLQNIKLVSSMILSKIFNILFLLSGTIAFVPSPCSQFQQSIGCSSGPLFAKIDGSSGDAEENVSFNRRAFMSKTISTFASASVLTLVGSQEASAKSKKLDYKEVANDIAALMKADENRGPTLVRLAWHSSGTYDKMLKTGGSGRGTIRFKEELAHGGNAGLGGTAVVWMEDVKSKYGDALSYADLYTLGGGKNNHKLSNYYILYSPSAPSISHLNSFNFDIPLI